MVCAVNNDKLVFRVSGFYPHNRMYGFILLLCKMLSFFGSFMCSCLHNDDATVLLDSTQKKVQITVDNHTPRTLGCGGNPKIIPLKYVIQKSEQIKNIGLQL